MDLPPDIGMPFHHAYHIAGHILRIGGGKANTEAGKTGCRLVQQFGKANGRRPDVAGLLGKIFFGTAAIPQVAVHILPQEGNFLETLALEFFNFLPDGFGPAATLTPARKGHHAKGAHIVASAGDGHKGRNAVGIDADGRNIVVGFFQAEQHVDRLAAVAQLAEHGRQLAVTVGAGHQVHQFFLFEDLFFEPFGHTADEAHFESGVAAFEPAEMLKPVAHGLFGLVAHGTGIDQDQVGGFGAVGNGITLALEDGSHDFAVVGVHLTTVGFDIYGLMSAGAAGHGNFLKQRFVGHITKLEYKGKDNSANMTGYFDRKFWSS